jgi:hypothetical protein
MRFAETVEQLLPPGTGDPAPIEDPANQADESPGPGEAGGDEA